MNKKLSALGGKNFLNNLKWFSLSLVLGLTLGAGLIATKAWTEPTTAPPGGNLGAPINTSNMGQWKEGNLVIATNNIDPISGLPRSNGFIVQNGNVGIGTAAPDTLLHISGYSGAVDLTNDASALTMAHFQSNGGGDRLGDLRIVGTNAPSDGSIGLASLAYPGSGLAFFTRENMPGVDERPYARMVITGNGGNIGIGTASPSSGLKLDVEGKVGATEYCDENGEDCTDATESGFLMRQGGASRSYGNYETWHKVIKDHSDQLVYDLNDEVDFTNGSSFVFTPKTSGIYDVSAHAYICDLKSAVPENYACLGLFKNDTYYINSCEFANGIKGGSPCANIDLNTNIELSANETLDFRIMTWEQEICMSGGNPGEPGCYAKMGGTGASWYSVTKLR